MAKKSGGEEALLALCRELPAEKRRCLVWLLENIALAE